MLIERFHHGQGPLEAADPETRACWMAAKEIRTRVFVEEQGCPWDEEFDGFDDGARHLLGTVENEPAATSRWRVVDDLPGKVAKLERFAILPDFRGQGRGRALVLATLDDARAEGFGHFTLNAQAHLEGFYQSLGFESTDHRFLEAGIPHLKMVRDESPEDHGPAGKGAVAEAPWA